MEFRTKLKRWGNSFGIVVPREIMVRENLKPGEEVMFELRKKILVKNAFGLLKKWKINAQDVKDELRKEWTK